MQVEPVRWLRVLLMGLAAEVALMIIVIPFALLGGERLLDIAVGPVTLIVFALFGFVIARPLSGRHVLHGALMGAAGVLIYNALILSATSLPGAPPLDVARTFSPLYLLSHALKLVGGGIGGWLASRKRRPD
ncbi:MAG TPA: hypothetical protein VGE65_09735 [Sphingobium sp.]